ncbi:unnamed protein product [Cuscuta campestris]|uniref:Uncharacterized protein n=1 Tax=Cuscuta campestris TaxID=132261 RepID=A0A484LMM8_9ASTE|nr:unnamed protein product [Cuscuta campestris]
MFILWDPKLYACTIVDVGSQYIHSDVVCLTTQKSFAITFVYALYTVQIRRELWDKLSSLAVCKPWAIMGDFNSVLASNERVNCFSIGAYYFNDLLHFRASNRLMDAPCDGLFFTWHKGNKLAKLDRVILNHNWGDIGADCKAMFLDMQAQSDHYPVLFDSSSSRQRKSRPFRFFNMWTKHEKFPQIVSRVWDQKIDGTKQFVLTSKLLFLKHPFKDLNRAEFGHISNRLADAKIKYKTLVEQLMGDPDSLELVRLVNKQRRITNFLIEAELAFYKQKAKCDFLTKGDICTKYFYSVVKKKRSTNSIPFLVRSDGTKTTCHSEVVDSFVDFFRGLFGTGIQVEPLSSEVLPSGSLVPVNSWDALLAPITIKEVKEAVFSIGDDKALGPDGFSASFFKSQWQLVGPDLFEAVAEFFHHGKLLKQLNHAFIALIPKTTHNPSVKDFRPIACLNVIYKVITKILAQRMAPLLPNLIGPAQGAFVEGQGWHVPLPSGLSTLGITHLAFADDIMLFSKGDFTSVTALMEVLNHFSAVSGLHLSPTKSNIFVAGRDRDRSEDILSLVHFPVGQLPMSYLGLPLPSQRLKESDFAPLINKIDNFLRGWSTNKLSYAGRVELLRAVIQGTESFWLQAFPTQKVVLNRITGLCCDFLWGSKFAKVAWVDICKPKTEGGLGLKEPVMWNNALLCKVLWNIANKKDSLWVRWVHNIYLNGRSVWSWIPKKRDSCLFKRLAEIRDPLFVKLGNPLSIEDPLKPFCFNNKLLSGKIYDLFRVRSHPKPWMKFI